MSLFVEDARGNEVTLVPLREVVWRLRARGAHDEFDYYTLHRGVALRIKGRIDSFELVRDLPESAPACELSTFKRPVVSDGETNTDIVVVSLGCHGGGVVLLDVLARIAPALGFKSFSLQDESTHPTSGLPTAVYYPLCGKKNGVASFYDWAGQQLRARGAIESWSVRYEDEERLTALRALQDRLGVWSAVRKPDDMHGSATPAMTWGEYVCQDAMLSNPSLAMEKMLALPEEARALIQEINKLRQLAWTFELPEYIIEAGQDETLSGNKRARAEVEVAVRVVAPSDEEEEYDIFAADAESDVDQ